MAFYQKYRSKNFSEMVGQEHIVMTLCEALSSGKFVHAYLFTGPRGIGKTSTARLLAKAINCQNRKEGDGEPCNICDSCKEVAEGRSIDVIEIDAASNTGVDEIRDLIEKARLASTKSKYKVYIIDEIHMLSKSAFNALLKTLEEPPAHVVFIMATTEAHKIPATILSRAQRYDFKRASKEEILKNLKKVVESEKILIDEASLDLIAVSANGGHRDALSLLEQISAIGKEINIEKTREILGVAEVASIFDFIEAIFNYAPEEGLKIAHELYENGKDMALLNRGIIDVLRKILLLQVSDKVIFEDTDINLKRMKSFSGKVETPRLIEIIQTFIKAGSLLKDVNYPILPMEIAIVKSASQPVSLSNSPELVAGGREKAVGGREKGGGQEIKSPKNIGAILRDGKGSSQISNIAGDSSANPQSDNSESKKISPSPSPSLNDDNMANSYKPTSRPADQPTTTVPVPVMEMTKDIWQQIIEKLKGENTTLTALLRDAKPTGMAKDTLYLAVKFKFHQDRISEPKNLECLEKVVCDVTGCGYKVVCEIEDRSKQAPKVGEDIGKAVMEVFEVE